MYGRILLRKRAIIIAAYCLFPKEPMGNLELIVKIVLNRCHNAHVLDVGRVLVAVAD